MEIKVFLTTMSHHLMFAKVLVFFMLIGLDVDL